MQRFALTILLACGFAVTLFAEDTEALIRVESHLEKIRKEVKFGRELGGGLLVGTGLLTAAGGTALAYSVFPGPDYEAPRTIFTVASLAVGAVDATVGGLILVLKTDYETIPEKFLAAPQSTPEERTRKLIMGDVGLQSLSDQARFSRFLSSGIMGVVGGAILVSGYTPYTNTNAYKSSYSDTQANSSGLYTGIAYLGIAVVNLFLETTPERENRAYRDWKSSQQKVD